MNRLFKTVFGWIKKAFSWVDWIIDQYDKVKSEVPRDRDWETKYCFK